MTRCPYDIVWLVAAAANPGADGVCLCCCPCVQVWNPCFDVTPGPLIEGIITEEGVVPRDTATGTHRVAAFMAARQQQQHQNGAGEGR